MHILVAASGRLGPGQVCHINCALSGGSPSGRRGLYTVTLLGREGRLAPQWVVASDAGRAYPSALRQEQPSLPFRGLASGGFPMAASAAPARVLPEACKRAQIYFASPAGALKAGRAFTPNPLGWGGWRLCLIRLKCRLGSRKYARISSVPDRSLGRTAHSTSPPSVKRQIHHLGPCELRLLRNGDSGFHIGAVECAQVCAVLFPTSGRSSGRTARSVGRRVLK